LLRFPVGGRPANPAGAEGDLIYNADHLVMQYCDGTNWYPTGRCQHGLNAFTDLTTAFPNTLTAPIEYCPALPGF
jgi:hypothetical protein